ncbi:MAG TPA: 1-aminocyclopropane-1-carboxylate deaminase/D-cysteine desulfhydrase [Bacteroidia bacterium]|nr:1-aminocyclopropane-1-carboxylate deaminase/D-cysteine desulfhydrase [Bacteroidia bacterium]
MSTIEKYSSDGRSFSILRLDLPDPVSGGNKYFKLKYNLAEMKATGKKRLLTFGGAYSNLIAAVSVAGKRNEIETIGIIRGEELNENSNAVLRFASSNGMQLHFVSREEYRKRNEEKYHEELKKKFNADIVLPEGGSNELAVKGCMEILSVETDLADVIFCPVGTGATLAGIVLSAKAHQHVIGIPALKGEGYLETEVKNFLGTRRVSCSWEIDHSFNSVLGSYGEETPRLKEFMDRIWREHHLPLEKIYSGRTFFAMMERMRSPQLADKKGLFIHTGGFAFLNEQRDVDFH